MTADHAVDVPAPSGAGRAAPSGAGRAAPLPRLRPLDFVAAEWNGERVVCVRDYEGVLEGPVLVPLPAMIVAMLLDGRRDLRAVQAEYVRMSGGMLLTSAELEHVVRDLDAHGLLDSPALEARRRAIADAYRAMPYRAMAHAGSGYPLDPKACATLLEQYLRAGSRPSVSTASHAPRRQPPPPKRGPKRRTARVRSKAPAAWPRGILAPHIDFARGGSMYGRAYAGLSSLPAGARIIVIGVAHAGPRAPYVLTAKGYETPFGVVGVDRPLLDALASRLPFDPLAEEAVHRGEHSVEFQVLWLAHVLGGRPFTVLPVLTGTLNGGSPDGPGGDPAVNAFIEILRGAIAGSDRPVCVVGGVDLSHVGPRFGDQDSPGAALARRAREADLAALRRVEAGDPDGWWKAVAEEGNRCHVCGLGAIYTVLKLLAPVRGRVLGYDQGIDPAGGHVGFSAVVFE